MEIIVYWDSLLLLNCIMNYWILRVVRYRFALAINGFRLLFASFVGSGIYLGLLLLGIWNYLGQVLENLLSMTLMVLLILPKGRRKLFGKAIGYGLFCTFFTAGLLKMVYAKLHVINRSSIHMLGVITIGFATTEAFLCYLRQNKNMRKQNLFRVELKGSKGAMVLTALLDTGNGLKEPISQRPVCLLEEGLLQNVLEKSEAMFRVVPYRSVGCEQGILYAYIVPQMVIRYGEADLVVKDVLCAEVPHKLSSKQQYEVILHPAYVEEI